MRTPGTLEAGVRCCVIRDSKHQLGDLGLGFSAGPGGAASTSD